MSSALRRAQGLANRYRVDRRLPPQVRALYQSVAQARRDDVLQSRRAAVRSVLGGRGGPDVVARLGARRVATAGPLTSSLDELALDTAETVVGILLADSLQPFVVDRDDGRVVIGLPLTDRKRALRTLAVTAGPGWFLRWADRSSTGLVPLSDALGNRRTRRARSWTVFRSYQIGERASGDEAGVILTFWTPGTSGEVELVGTRGHERFDARSVETTECIGGRAFPGRSVFPVGASLERFDGEVDVVYTWVDGADPDWVAAFRTTADACGRSLSDEALDPARYRSRDELRYSLRSLWMNCGWVRHIWIVTAGQRPTWLVDHPRISIVDHRDILPADALPTFNSHAIEASLHHIDGLAEHVVYFNDDMMITRPLRPEAFFRSNGLPKVFQSGARVPAVEDDRTQAVDTAAIRGRELLRERFGRVAESKPLHSPYPLLRSVMAEVEDEFPDVVGATRHSRFRSPSDLSTAASFTQHYALATQRATLGEIATEYVHVESGRLRWHLDHVRFGGDIDTLCLNETRDGSVDSEQRETEIHRFFESMYPVAAPWEAAESP
jgi:Stealth protein CR2, conserved region 2/Stealth protein CR3, conserved region 3/Stealth protein CR1, conserved region 1/Stealth protein CR4, conserved region 4